MAYLNEMATKFWGADQPGERNKLLIWPKVN
jgi:hypothetical protein